MRQVLFICFLFLSLIFSSFATDLFVDTGTGNNEPDNSCSLKENPCASLHFAIQKSSPHDNIILLNQKITVNEPIFLRHSLTISSEIGSNVWPIIVTNFCKQPLFQIIEGGNSFSFQSLRFQNPIFEQCAMFGDTLHTLNNNTFVISNQFLHKSEWKKMAKLGTTIAMQNVTFENMSALQCLNCTVQIQGAYFYNSPGGTVLVGASNLTIQDSIFDQFYEPTNITVSRTGLILVTSATAVRFDNCIIKNMRVSTSQRFFARFTGKRIFITNSHFFNNSMSSHFLAVESASVLSNNHFYNNTITGLGILLRGRDDMSILFSSFVNNTAILGSIIYYSNRENTYSIKMRDKVDKHNFEFFGNLVKGNRVISSPVGVVSIYGSRRTDLINNIFIHNEAQFGGALNLQECKEVTIRGCTFAFNKAILAGAMYLKNVILKYDNGNGFGIGATMVNIQCVNNTAQSNGGCLYATASTLVSLELAYMAKNSAIKGMGGALFLKSSNSMVKFVEPGYANNYNVIHLSTFKDNKSNSGGGTVYINSNHLSVQFYQTLFDTSRTSVSYGGAIYARGLVKLVMNFSTCKNARAFKGGCVYFEGLLFQAKHSSFINCSATAIGGALSLQDSYPYQDPTVNPSLLLNDTLFQYCKSQRSGGAVYMDSPQSQLGHVVFQNCTSQYGGALFTKHATVMDKIGVVGVSGHFGMIATTANSIGTVNRKIKVYTPANRNDPVIYFLTPIQSTTTTTTAAAASSSQIFKQKNTSNNFYLPIPNGKISSKFTNQLIQLSPAYNTISHSKLRSTVNTPQSISISFYNALNQPVTAMNDMLKMSPSLKEYPTLYGNCFDVTKRDSNCPIRISGIDVTLKSIGNLSTPLNFTVTASKLPVNSTITLQLQFSTQDYSSMEYVKSFSRQIQLTIEGCSYDNFWSPQGTIPRQDASDASYWYCTKTRCPAKDFTSFIAFSTLSFVSFVMACMLYCISLFVSAVVLIRQRLKAQVYHFWSRFAILLVEFFICVLFCSAVGFFFVRELFFDTPSPANAYQYLSWFEHVGHFTLSIGLLLCLLSLSLVITLLHQVSNMYMEWKNKCRIPSIIGFTLSQFLLLIATCTGLALYLSFYFLDIYNNNTIEFYSYNVSIYLVIAVGMYLLLLFLHLIHVIVYYVRIVSKRHTMKQNTFCSLFMTPIYLWLCYGITGLSILLFYVLPSCKIQFLFLGLTVTCISKLLLGVAIFSLQKVPLKMKAIEGHTDDISTSLLHDRQQIHNISNVIELEQLLPSNYIIPADQIKMMNQLGAGAQASVYKAEYNSTEVAVKCFPTKLFGTSADLKDFFTEASALLQYANHTNILRFIGVVNNEEQQFVAIVTEFCSNGSLANLIDKSNVTDYTLTDKLKWLLGIASGMVHLHKIPIIHRDLKCENVLIDGALTPKIADFGFAKYLTKESSNLTLNVGTAAFTAPEVFKAASSVNESSSGFISNSSSSNSSSSQSIGMAKYDERCDVYSYGIIIYCVLTGSSKPYGKLSDMDIILRVSKNGSEFRPSLENDKIQQVIEKGNRWIVDLMTRCWSSNVDLRPSFVEIASMLKAKIN